MFIPRIYYFYRYGLPWATDQLIPIFTKKNLWGPKGIRL